MIFIALIAAVFAQSGPRIMNDAELVAAYAGKTHESFYRKNVEEYGGVYFEETYRADGTLAYIAGDVRTHGEWRVANKRICFYYPETPLSSGCFAVVNEGGCYYSYQIGDDGKPIGLARGEWWIRARIAGTDAQCSTPDLVS